MVACDEKPGPGQIRNSNAPMLAAWVADNGGQPDVLGIGRDDPDQLLSSIEDGLRMHDVLLLSGGVSAGTRDFVPGALAKAGVEQVFHKVNLKPGKPVWFGMHSGKNGQGTPVFGLPGNPVSALVCSWLLVLPAMDRLAGRGIRDRPARELALARDFEYRTGRPTYFPACCDSDTGCVTPLPWRGSADLRTLTQANGFLYFDAGHHKLHQGDIVLFHWFDDTVPTL